MTKIPLKVELETGVGIPLHGSSKYPFQNMKVGESFFVSESDVTYHAIYSAAASYSHRHKEYKFVVRKVEGGSRVWRTQ